MNSEVAVALFSPWISSFAFSLAIEIPLFVLVARFGKKGERTCSISRQAVAGTWGTFLTHPLLWFVWPQVVSDYTTYIVSGELIIVLVESLTFFLIARPVAFKRALLASLVANAVSYGLGWAIH